MQAILQEFLGSRGADLTDQLGQTLGQGAGQASGFLSSAVEKILGAVQSGSLDPQALLGGDAAALAEGVDTEALADEAGVAPEQARAGVMAIAPSLGSFVQDRLGGADGLLEMFASNDSGGGLLGSAKKALGGLFG